MTIQEKIQQHIDSHRIVLFMKGSADFPQCGFSAQVCEILHRCEAEFVSIDVLEDDEIRQGIKEYSQWPTIPQLYVDSEFIGGCDIVTSMYESGDLKALLASPE